MSTYSGVIHVHGYDFWIEADYTDTPFVKGHRSAYGEQIDPDEPAGIEIQEIRMANKPDDQDSKKFKTELPDIVLEDIKQEIEES